MERFCAYWAIINIADANPETCTTHLPAGAIAAAQMRITNPFEKAPMAD